MKKITNIMILLMLITSIGFVSIVTATPLVQNLELSTYIYEENTYINNIVTTNGNGEIYFTLNNDNTTFDNSFVSGINTKTIKNWKGTINWYNYVTTPFIAGSLCTVCVYNSINNEDYKCSFVRIPEPKPIPVPIPEFNPSNIEKYDNEAPFIKSVIISSRMPPLGKNILVTVEVEDNIAVSKVMADEITLAKDAYNTWKGVLLAKEGTNKVFVIAQDEAGNSATSKSISYTTMKDVPPSYNDGNRNYDKDTNEKPSVTITKEPTHVITKEPTHVITKEPTHVNIIEDIKNKIMDFFNF